MSHKRRSLPRATGGEGKGPTETKYTPGPAESRFGFKAAYTRQLRAAASIASVLWDDRCNCNGIPAKAEGTLRPPAKLLDKRGQDEVAPAGGAA